MPPDQPTNAQRVRDAVSKFREGRFKDGLPSLGAQQRQTRIDRGPSTSSRVCPVRITLPEDVDAADAVMAAVRGLGDGTERIERPQASTLDAEWVGAPGKGVNQNNATPDERYQEIRRNATSPSVTILLHGGGSFRGGLGTTRPVASALAQSSGGQVIALDYRLAPQHPFPAQIIDLLVLYIWLLHPPAGAHHDPIPASSIVFAGESFGASICMGLVQALLYLKGYGNVIPASAAQPYALISNLPMPAGVAMVSLWADIIVYGLQSSHTNRDYDIFGDSSPFLREEFPADSIWPTHPPRAHPFCDASTLHHPMAGLCAAKSWRGAPPMWIAMGQERMIDAAKVVAKTAARAGVPVLWSEYDHMPHCWFLFVPPALPQVKLCIRSWGRICKEFTEGQQWCTAGKAFGVEDLEPRNVNVRNLTDISPDESAARIKREAAEMEPWTGTRNRAAAL